MDIMSRVKSHGFVALFLATALIALFSFAAPGWTPPNYNLVFMLSIPSTCMWVFLVGFSLRKFGKKALWMLVSCPAALFWLVLLLLTGVPSCYANASCS